MNDITQELRERPAAKQAKKPAPPLSQAPAPPDFTPSLLSAHALACLELPERPRLLGDWMREGDLGYLFAPRGHGKTWMAMLIAHAIAEGVALREWTKGDAPRPVFYFDAEMNLPDVQDRARKIGITSPQFHFLSNEHLYLQQGTSVNIADPLHQTALSAMMPDGALLIIDNLSTGQKGMRENENDDFDKLKDWLLELRRRRITVLIVHHAGRSGDNMRGGSRREDPAHWIISLKDDSEEGTATKRFITSFTKCRNCQSEEAPPLRWTMHDDGQRITLTCERHGGKEALLGLIRDGIGSATELADMLGVKPGTVSKWAKKLIAEGLVKKDGREYVPTEPRA